MTARDAGWFDTLFATHAPAVFCFLVRRAQRVDADDLTADVFVIAWRRRSPIPPPAELPWLYRTAGLVLREPSPPQAAAGVAKREFRSLPRSPGGQTTPTISARY